MFKSWIIFPLIFAVFFSACRVNFVHRPRHLYRKPVVYLYPEHDTAVTVSLQLNGTLIYSAPSYNNGWKVIAHPNGTLTDVADGKTYPYLYWEASSASNYSFKTGYVIPGDSAEIRLKQILPLTGLNEKETNDFIAYWAPELQKNELNLVSFPLEEYERNVQMNINPAPDQVLRVFMAFRSVGERISITAPQFPEFHRSGFTVVEWGGIDLSTAADIK